MGTYVTGDPASLRHAAAQLRHRADVFMGIAAQVDSAATSMVYVGPAGDQYRAGISTTSSQLRGTCARIADLADRLSREADRVEAERLSAARQSTYYYD